MRTRKGINVVPDIFLVIAFNGKSFFSALGMFCQGAVCETKSPHGFFFIDDVDDTTGIQRIKAEVPHRNRNVGSNLDLGARPMKANPRHAEHFPCANRIRRTPPYDFASAKLDAIVVQVISRGRCASGRSNFRVGES